MPKESGSFSFTVRDAASKETKYTLEVGENTESNFDTYADPGYELTQLVPDTYIESLPETGDQLMVSIGAYEEFVALYLDGEELVRM